MKKIKYLIVIIILLLTCNSVLALSKDDSIHDYALIFTPKQEEKIKSRINKYKEKFDANISVVTVQHKSINNLKDYMNEYYKLNLDGDCILIVIDLEEKLIDAKAYGSIKDKYPKENIQGMLDEIQDKKGYYKKTMAFLTQLIDDNYISFEANSSNIIGLIVIILISSIIPTIITGILKLKNKETIEIINEEYLNMNSLEILKREDSFKTTRTKRVRK